MTSELTLRYDSVADLQRDFDDNLRKGRAFVRGASGLSEREFCTLCIEHPEGKPPMDVRAEAVWICADPENPGTGVQFIEFDASVKEALREFARGLDALPPSSGVLAVGESGEYDAATETNPSVRNLHDRVRELDLAGRDALARSGSLPERVALERRFGSSVWEALLHNPQITAREVVRMAKSGSLPTTLVNLIVANKAWLADGAIQAALLQNPRVTGPHLDRVLRALPQAELQRISEMTSHRSQVRMGAKKLIRR
jgi:hypothetical protein